jgi:hypothetical protein
VDTRKAAQVGGVSRIARVGDVQSFATDRDRIASLVRRRHDADRRLG